VKIVLVHPPPRSEFDRHWARFPVLGLAYVAASLAFALREDARRARLVLLVSLVYLPALFSLTLLDPVVRAACARPIP
jgi:heme O synthase-like polyprenyltransferase